MAATIQYYTGGTEEKCIALSAAQFGRTHGYGNEWNTLRFGLLLSNEDSGASLTGVVLRIALCSGVTNMPGDATTDNSYGIKFSPSWSRLNSPPVSYRWLSGSNDTYAFTRVGAVETTTASGVANIRPPVSGVARSAFFLDVTKGSPNYTFNFFMRDAITTNDITPATFMDQVSLSVPTLLNHAFKNPTGSAALAVDESNGVLDTVYVGWAHVTPRILISNIAVVRLA
jgi:hypothetical protein